MKRTVKVFLIICCLATSLLLCLTACSDECEHIYDNACDIACNLCEEAREIEHDYSQYETNVAKHVKKCSVCGVLDEATREEHVYDVYNGDYTCDCGYELIAKTVYPSNDNRYVYLFSQEKHLLFTIRYTLEGELHWVTENYYDEAGNNIRYLDFTYVDETPTEMLEGIMTFDEKGRRIREEYYNYYADSSRELRNWRIRTYSEDGLTGKIEYYDADGNKTSEDLCLYDTNGSLTTRVVLNGDGTLNYVMNHVYGANGRERQTITFQDDYYRITDHNAYHIVIKHSYYYDDGRTRIQSYTENGDLISDETTRPDGTKTTTIYEKGVRIETVHEKDGVVTDRVTY